jgi:hypothetical protein
MTSKDLSIALVIAMLFTINLLSLFMVMVMVIVWFLFLLTAVFFSHKFIMLITTRGQMVDLDFCLVCRDEHSITLNNLSNLHNLPGLICHGQLQEEHASKHICLCKEY